MKLPELVQNIRTVFYNNRIPNSNLIDNRQIIYWINEQRALFLKQEYNKVRLPDNNEKQILYNIELEPYTDGFMPITINENTTLLRSKLKLPRTIQYIIGDGIISVRSTNILSERINYVTREEVIYKGNGIFNRKSIYAFKSEDYLWIKYASNSDKSRIIKTVILEGIFEDPLSVDIFNNTPDLIRFGNSEYPIAEAFLPFIEENIFKINIQRFIKDLNPNDEEDIQQSNTAQG